MYHPAILCKERVERSVSGRDDMAGIVMNKKRKKKKMKMMMMMMTYDICRDRRGPP